MSKRADTVSDPDSTYSTCSTTQQKFRHLISNSGGSIGTDPEPKHCRIQPWLRLSGPNWPAAVMAAAKLLTCSCDGSCEATDLQVWWQLRGYWPAAVMAAARLPPPSSITVTNTSIQDLGYRLIRTEATRQTLLLLRLGSRIKGRPVFWLRAHGSGH